MPLMRGITRSVTTIDGTEGGDLLERLGAVGGRLGGEAPRAHQLGQAAPRRGIVLDDQDAFGGVRRFATFFNLSSRIDTLHDHSTRYRAAIRSPRRGRPGRPGSRSCCARAIPRRSLLGQLLIAAGIQPLLAGRLAVVDVRVSSCRWSTRAAAVADPRLPAAARRAPAGRCSSAGGRRCARSRAGMLSVPFVIARR